MKMITDDLLKALLVRAYIEGFRKSKVATRAGWQEDECVAGFENVQLQLMVDEAAVHVYDEEIAR